MNVALDDNDLRTVVEPPLDSPADPLSARERQVIELVALSFANREVAERLNVSKKTVDTYRVRLSAKLGLKSRADIVRYALDAGVLKSPGGIRRK